MEVLPVEEVTILYKNHSVLHIFKVSVTEFWDTCTVAHGRNPSEMRKRNVTNAGAIKQLFWSELFFWQALISHPPIFVGLLCYNFSERMVRISQRNPVYHYHALLSYVFLDVNMLLSSKFSALHTCRPHKYSFFFFCAVFPPAQDIFSLLTAVTNPSPLTTSLRNWSIQLASELGSQKSGFPVSQCCVVLFPAAWLGPVSCAPWLLVVWPKCSSRERLPGKM